jgi:proteic killer suppression protein
MLVEFEDDDLGRLFEDLGFHLARLGPDLTKAFRKTVTFIQAATDERDLYAMKSRHYEKLEGDRAGQHSLRLNDQWRLIVQLRDTEDGKAIDVIEIEDYH